MTAKTKKSLSAVSIIGLLSFVALLGFYFVNSAVAADKKSDDQAAEKSENGEQEQTSGDKELASEGDPEAPAAEEGEKDKKTPIPVRATEIRAGRVSAYISSTANLVPESQVKVLAEWEGRLAELKVEEGDHIRQDQILAGLAREDGEIAVKKAQIRASTAQMAYDRAERLRQQELLSPDELDKVALESEIAAQELAEAEWRLEKTLIRAPFAGRVTERVVQPGQHVRPGDELFTVADFNPLITRIYLPEKDVLSLTEGREVRIALKADESIVFPGRIRRISPVVDTATGTVKVTIEAANPPRQVRPGAFVRVDIVREAHADASLVPREAVVRELQKTYLFVVNGGVAEKRAVTLGIEEDGEVEVTGGAVAGEQVIVAGQGGLKDGADIELIDDDGAA